MKTVFKKNYARYLGYLAFAIFYFWMAAQIPYSLDDWEWGLDRSIQHLLTGDINGRYAGNFFVIVMTRSELLKTLILGSVYFLLPFLMAKVSFLKERAFAEEGSHLFRFLCANILLFAMGSGLWRQTYGWVAGFANYVISAAFLTAWIYEIMLALDDTYTAKKNSWVSIALLCIVSVLGQLFLENLAIYCVLLSAAICFVHYKRSGKVPLKNLIMLVGAILGLVITFSSGIYAELLNSGTAVNGIRELTLKSETGITGIIYRLFWQTVYLVPRAFGDNLWYASFILVWMSLLLIRKRKETAQKRNWILVIVNLVIAVYFVVEKLFEIDYVKAPDWRKILDFAVNFVYYLVIIAETVLLFKERKWFMYRLLAVWLSVAAVLAPLVATTEAGRRLYFTSDLFIMLFIIMLLNDVHKLQVPKSKSLMTGVGVVVSAVAVLYFIVVYSAIGECKVQRDRIVADAVRTGVDTVVLPKFPFDEYLWYAEPGEKTVYFLEFSGLAPDTQIIIEE